MRHLLRAAVAAALIIHTLTATAQGFRINISKTDGSRIAMPVKDIESIVFLPVQTDLTHYERFTGDWYLVAQPSGTVNEQGIHTTTTSNIHFVASLPPAGSTDYGLYLYCHADSFYQSRSGQIYPADWRLEYVFDPQTGRGQIGMELSEMTPASTREFLEQPAAYLDNGTFYWGVSSKRTQGDSGHRYIYLLTENIDRQALEGMTLWAEWTEADVTTNMQTHAFVFPQKYEIYGIVSLDRPCFQAPYPIVGYIDIWAGPRLSRQKIEP
ncbi:MAG: hypothetical protein K6G08_07270 [Prevotella sp.]|nr:hypothetical protein [Prevotella sp.]